MMRYTVLVIAVMLLLSLGTGVLFGRQEIPPAGQENAPFSFHLDDPSANDRMMLELETTTLLNRFMLTNDAARRPVPSRIPHFFIIDLYAAGLLAILVVWRNLPFTKLRHIPFRLFFMPLGSQAPPAFPAAAGKRCDAAYHVNNRCGLQAA